MRIAYLITAYDQPGHLSRLVAALDGPGTDFYVHIDKCVDLGPFAEALRNRSNVYFAPRRIPIRWMGFSQVESILQLLTQAFDRGFDYCVLLSGSDYPIKPNVHIRNFYATADREFIVFWRLSDRPSWQHKIEYFYPIDLIPIWGYSKDREPVYWRRLFWGRFNKYRRWMPKRRFPFEMIPYGGSDWWSLSRGCASYVLRFVNDNPGFSRFYRYTHCPSEMFFHTIIMNSEWSTRANLYGEYEAWSAATPDAEKVTEKSMLREDRFNLRYIDWGGVETGAREAPAILDDRDWDSLTRSSSLFARKFEVGRSAALLDRIDREILGPSDGLAGSGVRIAGPGH